MDHMVRVTVSYRILSLQIDVKLSRYDKWNTMQLSQMLQYKAG